MIDHDSGGGAVDSFAEWCLESVRSLLAPGSALDRAACDVAHRQIRSIDLDRCGGGIILVARLVKRDGDEHIQRFDLAHYIPVDAGRRTREEASQIAIEIAANIAEP